jgi:hypothetical protein
MQKNQRNGAIFKQAIAAACPQRRKKEAFIHVIDIDCKTTHLQHCLFKHNFALKIYP